MPIGYGSVQLPSAPSLEEIANIGNNINAINRAGQSAAQAARIPGEEGLSKQQSGVIGQELQGYVPDDVMNLLKQQGAEGSTMSGISPNTAFLRALGLTSLDQQQKGVANMSTALAESPGAPLFDPTSQLLTPAQAGQLSLGAQNLELQQLEEADRMRLAEQELALRGANAGAGGVQPRSPGGQGIPDISLPPTVTASPGANGSIFSRNIPDQQQWWQSIGYGPGQPTTTTNPGFSYVGQPTSTYSAFGGSDPYGVLGDQPPSSVPFQPGDYEALFGPDLASQLSFNNPEGSYAPIYTPEG